MFFFFQTKIEIRGLRHSEGETKSIWQYKNAPAESTLGEWQREKYLLVVLPAAVDKNWKLPKKKKYFRTLSVTNQKLPTQRYGLAFNFLPELFIARKKMFFYLSSVWLDEQFIFYSKLRVKFNSRMKFLTFLCNKRWIVCMVWLSIAPSARYTAP